MDKMRMESVDITTENIEKIGALFPNCITETIDENGHPKKAINFEILKQMLSRDVIEGDEAYEFTWVGKKAAIVEANKPIRKNLRPCKEESVNWDSTENLYIEGDNLEVLKLLQESYLGKVKMIYIDPPYNTGNDFIYNDDFKMTQNQYSDETGETDDEGNRLFKNTDTNGRFHSDWCSMIYSRLMLARNLLADDGVIFISIDDNEQANLKKICDEVFGHSNSIGNLPTIMNLKGNQDEFAFAGTHEYTLVYAKNKNSLKIKGLELDEEEILSDWLIDDIGYYKKGASLISTGQNAPREHRPNLWFPILYKDNELSLPTEEFINSLFDKEKQQFNDALLNKYIDYKKQEGYIAILPFVNKQKASWRWSLKKFQRQLEEVIITKTKTGISLNKKQRPDIGELPSKKVKSLLYKPEYSSGNGTSEVKNLFNIDRIFSNPKPIRLLKDLIEISTCEESLILDFFAGSATTAHAVMKLNSEDGGNRKFIMVQLPEPCDEKSEAYKEGYKNICEIGKERIRRAAKKIHEDNPEATFDDGFRVLKLDNTNMNDVYYNPEEYTQGMLSTLESNIKSDRTDLDLLFGCLLEWGLPLSLPYSSEQIDGYTVHNYNDGDLIACFEENVPDSVIKEIAKKQPLRAVFRDSSFANSPSKINVGEIFKLMAPDTRVKVI